MHGIAHALLDEQLADAGAFELECVDDDVDGSPGLTVEGDLKGSTFATRFQAGDDSADGAFDCGCDG